MHGIALHCVATGQDRLMSEQGNGLDPVSPVQPSQSVCIYLYCTCRAERTMRVPQSTVRGSAPHRTALSGHDSVPGGVPSPPAHRPVVRARRYMPCSSGPVTGCVPVFVDAPCIGF